MQHQQTPYNTALQHVWLKMNKKVVKTVCLCSVSITQRPPTTGGRGLLSNWRLLLQFSSPLSRWLTFFLTLKKNECIKHQAPNQKCNYLMKKVSNMDFPEFKYNLKHLGSCKWRSTCSFIVQATLDLLVLKTRKFLVQPLPVIKLFLHKRLDEVDSSRIL